MKTSTRIIPAGTNYLSDVMTELPINCLFNKGVTGCGGTTIKKLRPDAAQWLTKIHQTMLVKEYGKGNVCY